MKKSMIVLAMMALAYGLPAAAGTESMSIITEDKPSTVDRLESFIFGEEFKVAGTCFSSGEQISGLNKICFYDCVSGGKAITIKSTSLCPLTIRD